MGSADSIFYLVDYIKNNVDWKKKLQEAPFFLKIKHSESYPNFVMFSYNLFESDFTNKIVRASRGSVLYIDKNEIAPILVPFYKFANFNESYADKINWNNVRVYEKLDGSLIKLARIKQNDTYLWTTNNSFDITAKLPENFSVCEEEGTKNAKTFLDLILFALGTDYNWLENVPYGWTLMFELLSPKNRIIVPYKKTELVLLGARDENFKEILPEKVKEIIKCPLRTPKVINLKNINQVINYCDSINTNDEEGVVVCDNMFNRLKIKCEHYRALKFIKGEDHFSDKGIFEAIKDKSIDDAILAYPEIEKRVKEILSEYIELKCILEQIKTICIAYYENECKSFEKDYARKKYAEWVKLQYIQLRPLMFESIKPEANVEKFINKKDYNEMKMFYDYLKTATIYEASIK